MAVKEYKVTGGGLVLRLDKTGKKVKRFLRNELVKIDDAVVDVERLLALGAIGDRDADSVSTYEQARRSNKVNQQAAAELVDSGAVRQSEDDEALAKLKAAGGTDDGGQGSSPTPPPGAPGSTPPVTS